MLHPLVSDPVAEYGTGDARATHRPRRAGLCVALSGCRGARGLPVPGPRARLVAGGGGGILRAPGRVRGRPPALVRARPAQRDPRSAAAETPGPAGLTERRAL